MAVYKILIGDDRDAPVFSFAREDLRGLPTRVTAVDVIQSTLSADELSFDVDYASGAPVLWSPANYDGIITTDGYFFGTADSAADLTAVAYGTPVWFLENETLLTKLYFVKAIRTGPRFFEVTATSAVGLLGKIPHMGNVYATTVSQLLQELIGNRFAYTVTQAVAAEPVRGWLPISTARENLHKMLFALGISILKDAAGNIVFDYLADGQPKTVPDARNFLSGAAVSIDTPVTAIEVTQHAYFQAPDAPEEQLFDNLTSVPAVGYMVTFDAPCFALRTTGSLSIVDSNANFATVSGNGTLYGRKYTHMTQMIRRAAATSANQEEKVVSVGDVGLINSLNAATVADRLFEYYSKRRTISATLKLALGPERESAGDRVKLTDADGAEVVGYLTKMTARASTFLKAQCTIVRGFSPIYVGNAYNAVAVKTASGSLQITAPGRYLFVLIGGGDGGQGGAAGASGKVLSVELLLDAGDSIEWNVGTGGVGGSGGVASADPLAGPVPGSFGAAGTETVVTVRHGGQTTVYTSATGRNLPSGYVDILNGTPYATHGVSGIAGGKGSGPDETGGTVTDASGIVYYPGDNPSSLTKDYYWPQEATFHLRATSGFGGGAAVGSDGGPGNRWSSNPPVVDESTVIVTTNPMPEPLGGAGGYGAAGAAGASGPNYGAAGSGGHGGGGGGTGGAGYIGLSSGGQLVKNDNDAGPGGLGGTGGTGGKGGDGALLVYSHS